MDFLNMLAPLLFLIFGYKFRYRTPPFKDKNGLNTKRSCASEQAWRVAHRFGGLVCIIMGVILAVLTIVKFIFFGVSSVTNFDWICFGAEAACLVLLYPIINLKLKHDFGK